MSRIGNKAIAIPAGVTITVDQEIATINGPKGTLTVAIPTEITLAQSDSVLNVARKNDTKQSRAYHGLIRSLIANAVTGVEKGYEKKLELHGVGYKAAPDGNGLLLNLGFSHPVKIPAVEGITFKVEKNTIVVSGIDKQLIGQVSANIREYRKPEPYKGKGIRYSDEYVRRKPGKAAKGATA